MVNATPKKQKAKKEPAPMVACDYCMDWHPKNKHTATKEQRDANVKEHKAKDPGYKPEQRII